MGWKVGGGSHKCKRTFDCAVSVFQFRYVIFQVQFVPLLDPRYPPKDVVIRYSCFSLNLGEGVSVGPVHCLCSILCAF